MRSKFGSIRYVKHCDTDRITFSQLGGYFRGLKDSEVVNGAFGRTTRMALQGSFKYIYYYDDAIKAELYDFEKDPGNRLISLMALNMPI